MTIFLLLTLLSISQTPSDSITCLPNSKLRKAIKEIENCKLVKEELELTKKGVVILEKRIATKDSIIVTHEAKDSIYKIRCSNYDEMVANLKEQVKNEKKISTFYNLKVATLKLNKWIFGGAGLLIGILIKSL